MSNDTALLALGAAAVGAAILLGGRSSGPNPNNLPKGQAQAEFITGFMDSLEQASKRGGLGPTNGGDAPDRTEVDTTPAHDPPARDPPDSSWTGGWGDFTGYSPYGVSERIRLNQDGDGGAVGL